MFIEVARFELIQVVIHAQMHVSRSKLNCGPTDKAVNMVQLQDLLNTVIKF
jgi:hypothetical protein